LKPSRSTMQSKSSLAFATLSISFRLLPLVLFFCGLLLISLVSAQQPDQLHGEQLLRLVFPRQPTARRTTSICLPGQRTCCRGERRGDGDRWPGARSCMATEAHRSGPARSGPGRFGPQRGAERAKAPTTRSAARRAASAVASEHESGGYGCTASGRTDERTGAGTCRSVWRSASCRPGEAAAASSTGPDHRVHHLARQVGLQQCRQGKRGERRRRRGDSERALEGERPCC
jgi:hypothetical protein